MEATINAIKEHTKISEGYSEIMYKCPAGKNTIGWGHNCEAAPLCRYGIELKNGKISKSDAENLLENDLKIAYLELEKNFKWYKELDLPRRAALLDMCFNMGISTLKTFKNTLSLIEKRDFKAAAQNALKSKWAEQVKGRAKKVCAILESGEIK